MNYLMGLICGLMLIGCEREPVYICDFHHTATNYQVQHDDLVDDTMLVFVTNEHGVEIVLQQAHIAACLKLDLDRHATEEK